MKRIIYISLFTLLGILVQFWVHGAVEIWYIGKLLQDFDKFSLGLTWDNWFMIHNVSSVILFILGAALGFQQGRHWWQKIYVEQPEWFRKRRFKW